MKASVVICTFNRSGLLAESISAAQKQDFPAHLYEILVVDNNSTDTTKDIVTEAALKSSTPIRYIFEGRQGLSHARNTGIKNANGAIIAFIDDDIDAPTNWLKSVVDAFEDNKVVAAGGPIRPIWPFERPTWLTAKWEGFFTINEYKDAKDAGEFHLPYYPWGANMAFRRETVIKAGMFSTDLGRTGTSLLSCEEKSLFQRIFDTGGKVAFAPNAVIHHKIPASRLNKLWLYHRTYWQGRSNAVIDLKDGKILYRNFLRELSILLNPDVVGATGFDQKCRKKEALGYIFQVMHADTRGDFRKLRSLLILLNTSFGGSLKPSPEPRAEVSQDTINRFTQELLRSKDEQINALLNSWSWRITKPLRASLDLINKATSFFNRQL